MHRRYLITLLSAIVSAMGAAALSGSPRPAEAQGLPDKHCAFNRLCVSQQNAKCCYGQWTGSTCDTTWPPPCPDCIDDCCSNFCESGQT